ncbi:hypothetical protein [Paraburkholderia sp. BL10I2N1]|uniref:hypothetical protein n=1 Tax=Paraburkholderia sp. BL10I2N1 TaxID=1938796 RepID=UPI0010E6C5B0|nr:hypothetical protein [Paraburkholderia sp. BL10I2N1]TDN61875.1 hypothetical protein B0G77_5376 [Paraburkholderia sp. BL10I2N1]
MKTVQWIAAGLVTLASMTAYAGADGNGGGHGGGHGGGGGSGGASSGGAGHGGLSGDAGGMSAGHMSSKGLSNTNGFSSADCDACLARAADRSDTEADRAEAKTSRTGFHSGFADHSRSRSHTRVSANLHHSKHTAIHTS